MSTVTTTTTGIAGCTNCGGTGYDAPFDSPCDCAYWIAKGQPLSWAARADMAGNPEVAWDRQPNYSSANGSGSGRGQQTFAASEKQLGFIQKLADERPGTDVGRKACHLLEQGNLSKRDASALIDELMASPKAQAPAPVAPAAKPVADDLNLRSIPSGIYAVPGGDTRLKVQIDVITKGKWDGWVFVKDGAEYGQGKRYGSARPGEGYRGEIQDALRIIVADPQAAMAAYGHLVGRCGMCHRPLEDEQSVERGIGPVCARKAGW